PKYNIHAEESGKNNNKSDYTIIIDPLDGTNNFALGIPFFSVCIALMHKNETITAVIHNPVTSQTFYAQKGQGAFINGKRLRVSNVTDIRKASVAYTSSYKMSDRVIESRILKNILTKKVKRVLTNWSPALDMCLLAQGRLDVYINNTCEIYDYVAGKLVASEAGAMITDLKGRPEKNDLNDRFVISNGIKLSNQVLRLIR
ncbi:inositol monophosphatase, partial [Patescibacteria group bacterium]|nr:inositol monophosphatase [Patescibacteria group bacterium]